MTEYHSQYYDKSPEEIIRRYMKMLNKRKFVFLLGEALLLVILCGLLREVLFNTERAENTFLFYLEVFVIVLAALVFSVIFRSKCAGSFNSLLEILSMDCDPAKFQKVMELLMKKDRFKRSSMTISLHLALADFHQNRPEEALARLEGIRFKSPKDVRWFSKYNIEGMCRHVLGDLRGRDACLEKIDQFRLSFNMGTENRQIMDTTLMRMRTVFKPFDQWGLAERAFAETQAMTAENRITRMTWQLYCAEYELLCGDEEKAAQMIGELGSIPPVPRIQTWVERLKKIEERERTNEGNVL